MTWWLKNELHLWYTCWKCEFSNFRVLNIHTVLINTEEILQWISLYLCTDAGIKRVKVPPTGQHWKFIVCTSRPCLNPVSFSFSFYLISCSGSVWMWWKMWHKSDLYVYNWVHVCNVCFTLIVNKDLGKYEYGAFFNKFETKTEHMKLSQNLLRQHANNII